MLCRWFTDEILTQHLRSIMIPGMRTTLTNDSPRFRIVPNDSALAPGIDPRRLNQLNERLQIDEFAEQCER